MKVISTMTLASTLLFALTSANAQSSLYNANQARTNNQSGMINSSTPGVNSPTTDNATNTPGSMTTSALNKNMPITITPDALQWKPAPQHLPSGAQMAILEGNPQTKGMITIRVKVPANYQLPPVYAQNIARITVLSGNINLGFGDKMNTNAGTALPAGSFVLMPANKHHYMWTTDESVVQVSGMGPFALKYVNKNDDPSNLNKNTTSSQEQTSPSGANQQNSNNATMPASQQPSPKY